MANVLVVDGKVSLVMGLSQELETCFYSYYIYSPILTGIYESGPKDWEIEDVLFMQLNLVGQYSTRTKGITKGADQIKESLGRARVISMITIFMYEKLRL